MLPKSTLAASLLLCSVAPLVTACGDAGTTSTNVAGEDGYQLDVLKLDGSNTLAFPADPRLEPAEQATIEFWVRPGWTGDPGFDPVVVSNAGSQGPSYMVAVLGNRDGLSIMSGDDVDTVPFDFTDGKMHHVALSDYGDGIAVMVDDEAVGQLDFAFQPLETDGLYIGSAHGGDDGFVGEIGGLRLWDVAVDPLQLATYRMRGVNNPARPHPDLGALVLASDFGRDTIVYMD